MTRLPPHDLPAEQAILGAILLEGRAALDRVALWPLVVTDFYVEAHRATFAAMRRLHDADHAVDVLTVSAELRRRGRPPAGARARPSTPPWRGATSWRAGNAARCARACGTSTP